MDTNRIDRLFEVIKLIAASYEDQIKVFPSFVIIPEELALLFDDVYKDIGQIYKDKVVSIDSLNLLIKIDKLFETMSKDPSKWNITSLKFDSDWNCIRNHAKTILEKQGIDNEKIDIDFVKWIKI